MGKLDSSIAGQRVEEVRLSAFEASVVDSTDYGDAYCADFIVGLSKGLSLTEPRRIATAASSFVITVLDRMRGLLTSEVR